MSLFREFVPAAFRGFPRVSGDEPKAWTSKLNGTEFSPRERG